MQAKLVIRDEINVKLEGVDSSTRKKIADRFKFDVPGARYLPAVRLGRWDGKVSLAQLGGSTYVNLLPDIIPMLESAGYDIDLEDLRDYRTFYEFEEITEELFADRVWPEGHPAAGKPIMMRDYQVEAINGFLKNTQCMRILPTGSGKTILTAALSYCIEPYGRSVIIVPNKSLVGQTEADYINLGLDVGVYYGDRKDIGKKHTICTWQSLNNLLKNTKNGTDEITIGEFLEDVVCVMVDEAHSAKSEVLRTLLSGPLCRIPIRWAFTGTLPKEEYARAVLKSMLGEVDGQLQASDLQEQGVLSDCHINIVQLVDNVVYKDYQSELKYLTETPERLAFIARLIDKIKEDGNTLILVDRIATGKLLQAELSTLFSLLSDKPDVSLVTGSTKAKERKAEYDEVGKSTNKILICTYGVAAVGINIVLLNNVVLFEPGKSFVRVIQSIGRGLRKGFGKDFVNIYDITSTCKFSKRHLTQRKAYYTESNYQFSLEKITWQ